MKRRILLPPDLTIRKMTLRDVDEVHALDQRSFSSPWSKKNFLFELEENDTARSWVAVLYPETDEEQIVGMIVCWLIANEVHIATLAVDEEYRRQGIGSSLICVALNAMEAEGATTAMLEVRESNAAAQIIYRRFGFQLVGRRPGYYKDNGEDAILMTLRTLDKDHLQIISCQ
jgi:ribosomal-protein-alanine N-acetyltransferase